MASKASIPRFLLPQYGIIWRTTPARTAPFARALNAELGQGLVRYASKTAATAKSAATATTASKTAAAKKVTAPKAASTKATAAKSTTAKASTTKATTTKVAPPKAAPAKAPAAAKAPATKAATPKTPTSQPAVKATPASASKLVTPKPAVKAAPVATPKPAAAEPVAKSALPSSLATPAGPSKPLILEKPEKFNPPSHGARLPRSTPKHYGGPLTNEEVQTQKTKDYPGLPPPENTWSHWFWNNRSIHLVITLGTLTSLAAYTFVAKFNATSAFADMVPPIAEFPSHPIKYMRTCLEVLKLHEEHESAITAEKRRRRVDDVSKRSEYRKAHGLDTAQGIESWIGSSPSPAADPALPSSDASVPAVVPMSNSIPESQPETKPDLHLDADGKRKKYWGVF